jgi:hypothetical protein
VTVGAPETNRSRTYGHSSTDGGEQLYHRSLDRFDAEQIRGTGPVWSADGTEVFYWGPQYLMSVRVNTTDDFRHDRPVPLFEHQQYSWNPQRKFDYDSRSDRFLMIRKPPPDEFPENRIVIVQNWIAEVERKLGST